MKNYYPLEPHIWNFNCLLNSSIVKFNSLFGREILLIFHYLLLHIFSNIKAIKAIEILLHVGIWIYSDFSVTVYQNMTPAFLIMICVDGLSISPSKVIKQQRMDFHESYKLYSCNGKL